MPRNDLYSMDKYAEGFVEACEQMGVDPAALVKAAQEINLPGSPQLRRPANWQQQQAPAGGWSYNSPGGQLFRQGDVSPQAYSAALNMKPKPAAGRLFGSAMLRGVTRSALGGQGGLATAPLGRRLLNWGADAGEFMGGMFRKDNTGPTPLDQQKQIAAAEAKQQSEKLKSEQGNQGANLTFQRNLNAPFRPGQ